MITSPNDTNPTASLHTIGGCVGPNGEGIHVQDRRGVQGERRDHNAGGHDVPAGTGLRLLLGGGAGRGDGVPGAEALSGSGDEKKKSQGTYG